MDCFVPMPENSHWTAEQENTIMNLDNETKALLLVGLIQKYKLSPSKINFYDEMLLKMIIQK